MTDAAARGPGGTTEGAHDVWSVTGTVVHGEQLGRTLGHPTANVLLPPGTELPPDGVYAGVVRGPGGWSRPAAVSVGTNPTVGGRQRTLEAYLLDFDGDLYGQRLRVDSVRRLRGMLRFDDLGALVAAMAADVAATRALVGAGEGPRDPVGAVGADPAAQPRAAATAAAAAATVPPTRARSAASST